MKTYQQCFDLIAEYCNSDMRSLPLFADHWNRFPCGRAANELLARIELQAAYWEARSPSIATALKQCAETIRANA